MEFAKIAWDYFASVLTPLGMILLAAVVWGEIKAWRTRLRVSEILTVKDAYIEKLTGRTLTAVEGYVKLTGLLEKIWNREGGR